MRIVAESFAIKALCLEKVDHPGLSRFKLAERESEMMRCFELGSDLSLLYLQEVDKLNNLNQGTISGNVVPHTHLLMCSVLNVWLHFIFPAFIIH